MALKQASTAPGMASAAGRRRRTTSRSWSLRLRRDAVWCESCRFDSISRAA